MYQLRLRWDVERRREREREKVNAQNKTEINKSQIPEMMDYKRHNKTDTTRTRESRYNLIQ